MHKIVFLERNSVDAEFRRLAFEHEWIEYEDSSPDQIVQRLKDATIVIGNKLALRRRDLQYLPTIEMIAVCATGLDRVDLEYCREKGIVVSNVRDYAGSTVAEHVLLLMLSLSRNFLPYIKDVEDGEWSRTKSFCLLDHPIRELRGKTLGIIGYGKLGIAVERVVLALGINVLIAEHKGAAEVRDGRTEFDEVLKRSDFLSLHTPLTEETRGMIGRREFNLMKPSALFINCARGGVMDENALVEALKAGKIGGAGIDVLHREPPPSDHPLLNLRNQNLIVTPHIAWASKEAMQALADQVIDNIEAFYRGQPRNVVT